MKHCAILRLKLTFPNVTATTFRGHFLTEDKNKPKLKEMEALQHLKRHESEKNVTKLLGASNY